MLLALFSGLKYVKCHLNAFLSKESLKMNVKISQKLHSTLRNLSTLAYACPGKQVFLERSEVSLEAPLCRILEDLSHMCNVQKMGLNRLLCCTDHFEKCKP